MNKKLIATAILAASGAAAMAATPPTFPGGSEAMELFITQNLNYPAPAKENGIEGIINLDVTINPDGTIGPVKVVRMIDPDLEQEAIRIVKKMPTWTPATNDAGVAVSGTVPVAISFFLSE